MRQVGKWEFSQAEWRALYVAQSTAGEITSGYKKIQKRQSLLRDG